MDVEAVRWLQTEDGQRVLAAAAALEEPDPLRAHAALARGCPGTPSPLLAAASTRCPSSVCSHRTASTSTTDPLLDPRSQLFFGGPQGRSPRVLALH